jgi:hypothetical protein
MSIKKSIVGMFLIIVLLSSTFQLGLVQKSQAQTSSNCARQALSIRAASGSQPGYPPSSAIDNNLNTVWSTYGIGSWIQVYAGSGKVICSVDIAWYRGNFRQYDFVISVWNPNIQKWVSVFSGTSSGTTANSERYNFPDVNGAFVMIRVNGNTENNYARISEIDVSAYTGSVDKFGIKKIYPTKSGGEQWYMNMNNPTSDGRSFLYTEPANAISKNGDGSWKIKAPFVRYHTYTSSGYHPELITTYNQKSLATKGYMQSPNDWKNVEMTGYIKVNSFGQDDDTAWSNRGGRHYSGQPCEGTGYKGDVYYSGKTRFPKEQWHSGGYSFSPTVAATSSIEDRWVGIKYVVYNFQQNGKSIVKLENWLDNKNDGNWVKIYQYTDSGAWGTQGTKCGGAADQIITWGGPIATFRWDGTTDVDIKNFSVREIQPPTP